MNKEHSGENPFYEKSPFRPLKGNPERTFIPPQDMQIGHLSYENIKEGDVVVNFITKNGETVGIIGTVSQKREDNRGFYMHVRTNMGEEVYGPFDPSYQVEKFDPNRHKTASSAESAS